MDTPSFGSYFNPMSNKHHALEQFRDLKGWQKVVTGALTGLVTVLTLPIFVLGVATFRALTEGFSVTHIKIGEGSGPLYDSAEKTNDLFNASSLPNSEEVVNAGEEEGVEGNSNPLQPAPALTEEKLQQVKRDAQNSEEVVNAGEEEGVEGNSNPLQPAPALTEEKLQQVKRDAQTHNTLESPYLGIPTDHHQIILSYLTDSEDLKNVAQTSEALNAQVKLSMERRTFQTKQTITQMIEFAALLDSEIKRITNDGDSLIGPEKETLGYHKFKFDDGKWQTILEYIDKIPGFAVKADELQNMCYLDLVEALAEYNINPRDLNGVDHGFSSHQKCTINRLISQIEINNIVADLTVKQVQILNQILDEAKCTLKGDMFMYRIDSSIDAMFNTPMLPSHSQGETKEGKLEGPFINFWLTNPENENWKCHYYERHIGGEAIHIDWLIGKREGDRILIPQGKEGTGDRQIILRFRQLQYRYPGIFEEHMARSFLNMDEEGRFAISQDARAEIIKNMENAYGKEFLDYIGKSLKK